MITRRGFVSGALLASAGALAHPVSQQRQRTQTARWHTGITWSNDHVEDAVTGIASLGFYGFETFGDILVKWEDRGGLGIVLEKHKLALISGYCSINLTDPHSVPLRWPRQTSTAKSSRNTTAGSSSWVPKWSEAQHLRLAASKANIVSTLNELAKRVEDHGLTPVLHQHTGTCVESRERHTRSWRLRIQST